MDRLVDRTVRLGPDAEATALPARARTVVVGGGVVGASVAYHLAAAGDRDVVLLERGTVASGTTWHAAGLVSRSRATPALSELAAYGVDLYARLQDESGVDVSFRQCGSVQVARTSGRLDELRRSAALSRSRGVPVELLGAQDVPRLWPFAVADGLLGALHQPADGHVNPGWAAVALAAVARSRGVLVFEHTTVHGVEASDGRVAAVRTSAGRVECERVVLACGLWTRDLAADCGVNVPLYPAEHVHVRSGPIGGVGPDLPVLRDLDGSFYVRAEGDRLLVGAFEPRGKPLHTAQVPAGGFAELPPDWGHFAPVRGSAEQRVPVLREAGYDRFLNGPESFTPDAEACLGEAAELEALFVAAGFNSQGIIYGPGAGRALAEWMTAGAPQFDASAVDVQRFARQQGNRRYLHARTTEALGRLYAMHWPHLQPRTARGVRRTPLHDRVAALGACFGETAGWERANWFGEPGMSPVYEYSYGRPSWSGASRREHGAAREGVAVFDLSSFTKVEVAGPDALAVVQQACTADLDVAVGRVAYTLALDVTGGIALDATVTRLAADRFLLVTAAGAQVKALTLLRRLARGRAAAVFDATAGLATIAVVGPLTRDLLGRVSPDDWSGPAQRWGRAREVEVVDGHALCLRVSYVGELGYELYPAADQAANVYDALFEAGADLGVRPAGYHALDSLRLEKGYRHLGHEIGPGLAPAEAGLEAFVAMDKPGGFVGRDALAAASRAAPARRTAFVALQDPAGDLLHDEAVLHDGRLVGRVTSGAFGHTLGRACGIALLVADAPLDGPYTVDCAGVPYDVDVSSVPFYDPAGERLRG